jgi:hypothetical protein
MITVLCPHCLKKNDYELNDLVDFYDIGQKPSICFPQKSSFIFCNYCKKNTLYEKITLFHDPNNKIILLSIQNNKTINREEIYCFLNDTILGIVDMTPPELRGTYFLNPVITNNFEEALKMIVGDNNA